MNISAFVTETDFHRKLSLFKDNNFYHPTLLTVTYQTFCQVFMKEISKTEYSAFRGATDKISSWLVVTVQ